MTILTHGSTKWYGVDDVGDAITVLDCGHAIGFPMAMLEHVASEGADLALRCTPHGVTTIIAAVYVPDIVAQLKARPILKDLSL